MAFFSTLAYAGKPVKANELIGFWQADTPDITDAYTDCYRFFADGRFTFVFSGYDETKRIVSLSGTYTIKDSVFSFFVTSREELEGGVVERNPQSSNGWYLSQGKLRTVKQPIAGPDEAPLEKMSPAPNGKMCIEIGATKFFKLSPDPNYSIN